MPKHEGIGFTPVADQAATADDGLRFAYANQAAKEYLACRKEILSYVKTERSIIEAHKMIIEEQLTQGKTLEQVIEYFSGSQNETSAAAVAGSSEFGAQQETVARLQAIASLMQVNLNAGVYTEPRGEAVRELASGLLQTTEFDKKNEQYYARYRGKDPSKVDEAKLLEPLKDNAFCDQIIADRNVSASWLRIMHRLIEDYSLIASPRGNPELKLKLSDLEHAIRAVGVLADTFPDERWLKEEGVKRCVLYVAAGMAKNAHAEKVKVLAQSNPFVSELIREIPQNQEQAQAELWKAFKKGSKRISASEVDDTVQHSLWLRLHELKEKHILELTDGDRYDVAAAQQVEQWEAQATELINGSYADNDGLAVRVKGIPYKEEDRAQSPQQVKRYETDLDVVISQAQVAVEGGQFSLDQRERRTTYLGKVARGSEVLRASTEGNIYLSLVRAMFANGSKHQIEKMISYTDPDTEERLESESPTSCLFEAEMWPCTRDIPLALRKQHTWREFAQMYLGLLDVSRKLHDVVAA